MLDVALFLESLYAVQDAGGVVHHAIGVDDRREVVVLEPSPDFIGKARSHAEHWLGRLYLKRCRRYVDRSAEKFAVHVVIAVCCVQN